MIYGRRLKGEEAAIEFARLLFKNAYLYLLPRILQIFYALAMYHRIRV